MDERKLRFDRKLTKQKFRSFGILLILLLILNLIFITIDNDVGYFITLGLIIGFGMRGLIEMIFLNKESKFLLNELKSLKKEARFLEDIKNTKKETVKNGKGKNN